MRVFFQGSPYEVVFTDHPKLQMELRDLSEADVKQVIEGGGVKTKGTKGKYWVYANLSRRKDNLISVSISVENPNLIVITAMVNWRPR